MFDLRLYEHRGVDLIEWDQRTGQCRNRHIAVRYLTRRMDQDELSKIVQQHSSAATLKAQGSQRQDTQHGLKED